MDYIKKDTGYPETDVYLLMEDIKLFQEEDSKEADDMFRKMKNNILELFRDKFSEFDPLYIFETWTHLGMSPNLLYDDDGLFAVEFSGYQSLPDKTEEGWVLETSFVIEGKKFKKTPKEAIEYACINMFED